MISQELKFSPPGIFPSRVPGYYAPALPGFLQAIIFSRVYAMPFPDRFRYL